MNFRKIIPVALVVIIVAGGVAYFTIRKNHNGQAASVFNIQTQAIAPITPACGSSNGQVLLSAPTTNLCSPGATASAVVTAQNGWVWTCANRLAPMAVSCSATLLVCPVGEVPISAPEQSAICTHLVSPGGGKTLPTNLCPNLPGIHATVPPGYYQSYGYNRQWGSEGMANGEFKNPAGVAIGLTGNIYVVDQSNSRVEESTTNGTYITKWGGLGVGNGQFNIPSGIAVDPSGNVYVVDTGVHSNDYRVQKFTSNGTYITQWGMHGGGDGHIINSVGSGIAVDRSGNVYVADSDYNRVQKFTANGAYITQWGSFGLGDGQFESVSGVAADDFGNVYTIDGEMGYPNSHHRVQKFTANGAYITQWGMANTTVTSGAIGYITTDSFGNVYVTSQFYEVSDIQKFSPTGTALNQWGSYGFGNGQFNIANGIVVDSSGNVYVADAGGAGNHNNRIEKFAPICSPLT